MPTLNDDAIYLGKIQTQFTSALSGGEVIVNWQFTIGASETFTNYDPSVGLVPAGFSFQGANFSPPSTVVLSEANISAVSSSETSLGFHISGTETSGTAQTASTWAVYTR